MGCGHPIWSLWALWDLWPYRRSNNGTWPPHMVLMVLSRTNNGMWPPHMVLMALSRTKDGMWPPHMVLMVLMVLRSPNNGIWPPHMVLTVLNSPKDVMCPPRAAAQRMSLRDPVVLSPPSTGGAPSPQSPELSTPPPSFPAGGDHRGRLHGGFGAAEAQRQPARRGDRQHVAGHPQLRRHLQDAPHAGGPRAHPHRPAFG